MRIVFSRQTPFISQVMLMVGGWVIEPCDFSGQICAKPKPACVKMPFTAEIV
jgi:hypothetical protein